MKLIKEWDALVQDCVNNEAIELWPGGPTGNQYLNGLVRVTSEGEYRGSFVQNLNTFLDTEEFIKKLDFHQVQVDKSIQYKDCKYYQAKLPNGHKAYEAIALLGETAKSRVSIRKGQHGDELIAYTVGGLQPTNIISIIIEDGMVSTWYPGKFTASPATNIPKDESKWLDNWAVKLLPML